MVIRNNFNTSNLADWPNGKKNRKSVGAYMIFDGEIRIEAFLRSKTRDTNNLTTTYKRQKLASPEYVEVVFIILLS